MPKLPRAASHMSFGFLEFYFRLFNEQEFAQRLCRCMVVCCLSCSPEVFKSWSLPNIDRLHTPDFANQVLVEQGVVGKMYSAVDHKDQD